VPDSTDLPADARARLDAFTAALERINVGDMSLYAIPGDEGFSDVARDTLGLTSLPVREEAGLIYVGLTVGKRAAALGGAESHDRASRR
jgi:hypothetical protein